jgi:hypothetical protein
MPQDILGLRLEEKERPDITIDDDAPLEPHTIHLTFSIRCQRTSIYVQSHSTPLVQCAQQLIDQRQQAYEDWGV